MLHPFLLYRHLSLFVLTVILLTIFSLLGLIEELALRMTLPANYLIIAILLIAATGWLNIAIGYLRSNWFLPPPIILELILPKRSIVRGYTLVTINLAGAVLPVLYSCLLWIAYPVSLLKLLLVTVICTIFSYLLSRPIPGFGIGMPLFSSPIASALSTYMIMDEHLISSAYIAGTLGVLLGADILRIRSIKRLGASFVSIGGAGIMDSIALTGIIAAILVSSF